MLLGPFLLGLKQMQAYVPLTSEGGIENMIGGRKGKIQKTCLILDQII